MIDIQGRLSDLHDFLLHAYATGDRQACDIILASRLKGDRRPPWLAVETDAWSGYTGWFRLGLETDVTTLSYLQIDRSYKVKDQILGLDRNKYRLFLEPNWRHPLKVRRCHAFNDLMGKLVSVRVKYPRINYTAKDEQQLGYYAGLCLMEEYRQRNPVRCEWKITDEQLEWLELLQRINSELRGWEDLLGNIKGIVEQRAELEFRDKVSREDLWAGWRVYKDSIRYPTWNAIKTAMTWQTIGNVAFKIGIPDKEVKKIFYTLRQEGMIQKDRYWWRICNEQLRQIIAGSCPWTA